MNGERIRVDMGVHRRLSRVDLPTDVQQQLQEAIEPSAADILAAKKAAMAALAGGKLLTDRVLFGELCREHGIAVAAERRDVLDVAGLHRGANRAFDPNDAQVVRARLRLTSLEAMGDLISKGLLDRMQTGDPGNGDVTIAVTDRGHSGGVRLTRPSPLVGPEPFRLVKGVFADSSSLRYLDPQLYLERIDELVGHRGSRCITESIAAYKRGLYLSSANMLGAANEAAWYTIGAALAALDDHTSLRKAVDTDRTGDVVRLSVDLMLQRKANIRILVELQAHEAYLRSLRNYGLHPRGDVDDDHEAAYTETGCGLLLMETRRYFVRLNEQATKVGL